MPRWTFEKFPEADETLTTQMKSVGEADEYWSHIPGELSEGHPIDGRSSVLVMGWTKMINGFKLDAR